MKDEQPAISEAEGEILKVLWEQGAKTVRDMTEILSGMGFDWNRSTVITLMQRLEKKGYVESDKSQLAFLFRPAVTREEVFSHRLKGLARDLSDGNAIPLILAFAEDHRFTPDEIERFRKLIADAEAKQNKKGAK